MNQENFWQTYRRLCNDYSLSTLQDDAYESIIDRLMVNEYKGQDKLFTIWQYDTESVMNPFFLPGNAYIFIYNPDQPYTYIEEDGYEFEFMDLLPMVLVTKVTDTIIQGINLNLCPPVIRAFILNVIYMLDENFFIEGAEKLLVNNKLPVSEKILKFMSQPNNQTLLLKALRDFFNLDTYSYIFRTYSIQKIRKARLIEPWQWIKIPFINYKDSSLIKQEQLDLIYKITKMDQIS